jgi:hypothetical protein
MAQNQLVKFAAGTLAEYTAAAHDANTLYFITDARLIYKGDALMTGGVYKAVTAFPAAEQAEVNTLYVNTANGEVRFYDGSKFQTVVKATNTAIADAGSDDDVVTSKAVVDYVASVVKGLSLSAVTGRIDTLEEADKGITDRLDTIEGSGEGSVAKALSDAKAYTDELADGAVATNASDIAALKSGKADKATTLEGYGIADAYTKAETDSAISTAVANADHLKRAIVDELPDAAAADANTIYMVKKGDAEGDAYNEYLLVNGKFEKIGDSTVDLTDYATKANVETAKGEAISTAATDAADKADAAQAAAEKTASEALAAAKEELEGADEAIEARLDVIEGTGDGSVKKAADDALSGAKAYADGLAGNYATAAQGEKADSAVQKVTTGTENGTVAVDGTNVAVAGLASAAYAATTDFDAAGTAATKASEAQTAAEAYADEQIAAALTWNSI